MTGSEGNAPERRIDFASFLRERRDDILAEWEKAAGENPRAAKLERLQLINFIPGLFDRIVDVVEEFLAGRVAELSPEVAGRHALDRLKEGFDLGEVVNELSLLRDCVLRLRQETFETADGHGAEHQILTKAVDRAIGASVDRYMEARDRMLRALDRVSSTALEARDLDELLERLVETFQEEVASVDTVAILLRDGDVLRVRAARGHGADSSTGLPIGDGFAGTIAAERRPRQLRAAAVDPLVKSELIRSQGIKALYGVPLIEGSELVGVAYMGSSTAEEFSDQDGVLFESMTSRASAGIYQQILRDRSEKRARELEESEQKFEATFENAAVGMAQLGLDGSWLRLNKKYCEILGYSHDELMQLSFQALTHPDDVGKDLDMHHRLAIRREENCVLEKRHVRKDGRIVWVDFSVGVVRNAEGRPLYFVAAAKDITRRKETEALLREREERLQEADRRKDEFIAMLGHELRNPLAAIRSAIELIKLTSLEDGRLQRAHGVLERQSAHMSRLVDGLLEVSRISRGKIHLDRETLDVRKIIDGVLEDRKPQLEGHRLQLTTDLPQEPVWVWGDRVRLAQVFDNLVGNAIKFTEPSGRITVTLHEEDGAVLIRIRDTGVGIRPEMLERLFEPFQQETQGIARAAGGLGLGLAVAGGLVELHGGSIQAHSVGAGAGAEFEIRLPSTSAPGELPQPASPKRAPPRRVLIVEDNTDAAHMLRELLELAGHVVTVAENGREALAALHDEGSEVVLCDLGLPGMSGYELAQAIRNDPELTDTPLVALTGYGQPEDRERTAQAGFDDHLTKPVGLAALDRVLDQLGSGQRV